jgi:hypothetical protein
MGSDTDTILGSYPLRLEIGKALCVDRTLGCRQPEMTGPEAQRRRSCSTPVVVADAQHLLRATFRRYRRLTEFRSTH